MYRKNSHEGVVFLIKYYQSLFSHVLLVFKKDIINSVIDHVFLSLFYSLFKIV